MKKKEEDFTISISCNPRVVKKMDDFIHTNLDGITIKDIIVPIECPKTIAFSDICTMFAASVKYTIFKTKLDISTKNEIELVLIKIVPIDNTNMNIKLVGLPSSVSIIEEIICVHEWKLHSQFVNTSHQIISNMFKNRAEFFHIMCERNLSKFIKVYQTSYGNPNPGLTITAFIKEKMDIFLDKLAQL
jgi:hypothetical protein